MSSPQEQKPSDLLQATAAQNQQFFRVEGLLQDEDDINAQEVRIPDSIAQQDTTDVSLQISLHAVAGTRAPQTMKILGTLQHYQLTILIDSGVYSLRITSSVLLSSIRLNLMQSL